ncbi:MAG: CHAD domain-containing protein [Kiloniellales bacterium]|nr:CHAD domain-containing protein [Kiloniellales bacterium]
MHEEIELKLVVSPNDLKRLRGDPLIRSLASRRASTKRLRTTYYDTPSHDLRQRGMALRVRQIGRRYVQTLKVPGNGASGLQHYREYEADVAADAPEVSRIDDVSLRQLLDAEKVSERLEPIFTTTVNRSTVPLKLEDSEVELALDSGEIAAGEESLPICEAELELVSGSSQRIFELALALSKRIDFRLETRTKAARGYQLSAGLELGPQKAKPFELAPEMTVGEVFVAAARACLEQIRFNEAVVVRDELAPRDPEGIHQLRVGVRRLRALVSVFRQALTKEAYAYLREELSWLQGALGPAREWDVFSLETLAPLRRRLSEDRDLAALAEAAAARRELANQAARAALLERRYTDLILRFELWLSNHGWALRGGGHGHVPSQRIGHFAGEALDKRARKLHKLTRKWKTLPEAELHEVRILAKKLRYTLEFFAALYPRKTMQAHARTISRIQDTLGSLNDSVVNDGLLAALEGEVSPRATAIVRGWQAACIERDLAHFRADLKDYEQAKPPWH